MIGNLLLHLGISLGLFLYGMLSLTMANGCRHMLQEKGRPRLGWLLAPLVAIGWPLFFVAVAAYSWYDYYRRGGEYP